MSVFLKPLNQQVIFITGATSGIGLATVYLAVGQGAKVFMLSRNEDELQELQDEMRLKGYETAYAVADVAEYDQLLLAADKCLMTFGRIDTWINNAGITIYSKLLETSDEEAKRLFDTNFWGVVNGCKVAIPLLKSSGGALINLGSVLSEVALPIQGIYSASKHAVKAYTDSLRRELMAENAPISVSLVMPGAIDTPYTLHGRSHIGEPVHTPPVYGAEVAAETVLKCAFKPTREIGVGSSAYLFPFMDKYFPKLQDLIMSKFYMEKNQKLLGEPSHREKGNRGSLFAPLVNEGQIQGNYPGHVMHSSMATKVAEKSSWIKGGAVIGGALLMLRKWRST
jgi:short-subunit dehydrogenase